MPRSTLAPVAAVVIVLAMLFAGYMGAYYAMLKPTQIAFGNPLPIYRSNSELVRKVFSPAHRLDLLIRPDYWKVAHP